MDEEAGEGCRGCGKGRSAARGAPALPWTSWTTACLNDLEGSRCAFLINCVPTYLGSVPLRYIKLLEVGRSYGLEKEGT